MCQKSTIIRHLPLFGGLHPSSLQGLTLVSQTIVSTALPTIVARLGGGEDYSWVGRYGAHPDLRDSSSLRAPLVHIFSHPQRCPLSMGNCPTSSVGSCLTAGNLSLMPHRSQAHPLRVHWYFLGRQSSCNTLAKLNCILARVRAMWCSPEHDLARRRPCRSRHRRRWYHPAGPDHHFRHRVPARVRIVVSNAPNYAAHTLIICFAAVASTEDTLALLGVSLGELFTACATASC